jgi:hypothetical protein
MDDEFENNKNERNGHVKSNEDNEKEDENNEKVNGKNRDKEQKCEDVKEDRNNNEKLYDYMPQHFEKSVEWVLVKNDKKRKKKNITDEILKDVRTQSSMQPKPRFDRNNARGESVGSFRQGLGLEARHSNCPQSWNGQLESLGRYLDSTLVDGNRVRRPSNRGKVLSRNIWNRVESMKRNGVKQANSKSRN